MVLENEIFCICRFLGNANENFHVEPFQKRMNVLMSTVNPQVYSNICATATAALLIYYYYLPIFLYYSFFNDYFFITLEFPK